MEQDETGALMLSIFSDAALVRPLKQMEAENQLAMSEIDQNRLDQQSISLYRAW
jgi:hypothetical protein